jgi:tripartite-type tricarboxylate transporter receptor subunit TctC
MKAVSRLLCALLALATCCNAFAQSYPNRPVKLVVPFGPGSGSDIFARLLAEDLRVAFNQPVLVENKPGGSAQIAAEYVAKSAPDGYTLFMATNTSHSANPFLFKTLRYDPIRDFTPVIRVLYMPYVLVVAPSSPIRSVADLVARARANPGKLNYGYGNSTSQVAGAAFTRQGQIKTTAVPYKSMPPAMTDLMAGQLDFLFVDLASSQGYIKSGQLRAIAFSLPQRSERLKDIPTVAETPGFAGYEVNSWVAIVGPAGLPPDVVERLNAQLRRSLEKPEIREKLEGMGAEVVPSSPQELDAFMRRQLENWGSQIRDAGIEPE